MLNLFVTAVLVSSLTSFRCDLRQQPLAHRISLGVQKADDGGRQEKIALDRFTREARLVVFEARREYSSHPADAGLEPVHILAGVLRAAPDVVSTYLSPDWSVRRLAEEITLPAESSIPEEVDVPLTRAAREILSSSVTKAEMTGSTDVKVEHLLLALLESESSEIGQLLGRAGIKGEAIRAKLKRDR